MADTGNNETIRGRGDCPKRVIANAYRYAEGVGVSREIELGLTVSRFGAQSVFGRVIGAGEIRRIAMAERIVRAYREREQAENWAKWVENNPHDAELLSIAAELVNGE